VEDKDANQEALEQVERITESGPVCGEDLLGSEDLPENAAGGQPWFRGIIPCPRDFRKKLYVSENPRGEQHRV